MFPLCPIIQSTPQSLKQHMRSRPEPSQNLVSCYHDKKTSNFATVQSFTGLYDSKLSTCHRSRTKLSSLLSLLKSSDFLLLLMLTLFISIISCWWITTSIGLDLLSAFNCIVLNRFHHKKIVLTIVSAFTFNLLCPLFHCNLGPQAYNRSF